MAEGGRNVPLCDICCKDNTQAIKYCKICIQRLCKECSVVHAKGRFTTSHNLLDIKGKSFSKEEIDDIWKLYECPKHPGRRVKYICTFHDEVCCSDCTISTHSHCEGLSLLSDECTNRDDDSSTLSKLTEFGEQTKSLFSSEEENQDVLSKSKYLIDQKLNEIEIEFMYAINDLKQRVQKELSVKYDSQSESRLLSVSNITKLDGKITTLKNEAQCMVDKEDPVLCYLYDRQHRRSKTLGSFRSNLSEVSDNVKRRDLKLVNLQSIDKICDSIRDSLQVQEFVETKYFEFGQLSGSESDQDFGVSMRFVDSNCSFEIGDADYVVCSCVWANEFIVIASNVKNELIMLDPLKQTIIHTINCEMRPTSMVAIDKMNIAVCYYSNTIDIFRIQGTHLKHDRKIHLDLKVLAVTVDKSHNILICLSPTSRQIAFVPLDKSLDSVHSVVKVAHDELDESYNIDYDEKVNKIYVANHFHGKVMSFEVGGEGFTKISLCAKVIVQSPFAVTVDKKGSVYVVTACKGVPCIQRYNRSLVFIQKLVSENCSPTDPCCMAFNEDGTRFIVAGRKVKTWIKVYNVK